jgi:glycosyltransferase involved in cell wall biosynthesis
MKGTLGIITEMLLSYQDGRARMHASFGLVIDILATRHERVLLCAPVSLDTVGKFCDYELRAANVELVPQPAYSSMLRAQPHGLAIVNAYARTLRRADVVFVRGMPPYSAFLYLLAAWYRRRPVHWIVGNPIALLWAHRGSFDCPVVDWIGCAYAYAERLTTRAGRWLTSGAFLCNGRELADMYASPRTQAVISTTITKDDFFVREDTCQSNPVRLLFLGFVRPEKGLDYLLEALPRLRCGRPWRLTIAGPWEHNDGYKPRLDALIGRLGIGDHIGWEGYVPHGPAVTRYYREHDIFVLPSVGEGTPRVLVEARANSLPLVATRVGGIPLSVSDGRDGLLVPPGNADALAAAIDRLVADGVLRRRLIQTGLQSARRMTIDRFVEAVEAALAG